MNYAFLAGVFAQGGGAAPPPGDIYFDDTLFLQEFLSPLDLSGNAFPIEIRGRDSVASALGEGVYPDTSKFRFGTQSMKCHEGGEAYVAGPRIDVSTNLDLGTGNFCIEFWMAGNAEPSVTGYWYGSWRTLSSQRHMRIGYNPTSNQVICEVSTTGANTISANFDCDTDGVSVATLWDGNFHHIAVTRNGGDLHVYVDGIRGATAGSLGSNAIFFPTTAGGYSAIIGASCNSNVFEQPDNGIDCWIDEFRFTKGISRYSGASFTPPSTIFGRNVTDDPDFANVELLLDFEGRWGFEFWSNAAGIASYFSQDTNQDDQWKNGRFSSSANTIGVVAAESTLATNAWSLGSGDFTIELFGWKGSLATGRTMVANYRAADGQRGWRMRTGGTSNSFVFDWSTDGLAGTVVSESCGNLTSFIGSATLNSTTEYDLCIERHGSNLNFYVDGVLVRTATISGSIFDPGSGNPYLGIGRSVGVGGTADSSSGEKKCVRITKGVARYQTADYTVPSLPLPKSA